MEKVGLESEAFSQLTRKYMTENFNPKTPDLESVKYGAILATCSLKLIASDTTPTEHR
jgi:triacylglycerol lipase